MCNVRVRCGGHDNTGCQFVSCIMMTLWNGNIFRVTDHCGESPATGEYPAQKPVTRSFDVFFDLRLNKRLSKQWWGWWFETPWGPFWRHCNDSRGRQTGGTETRRQIPNTRGVGFDRHLELDSGFQEVTRDDRALFYKLAWWPIYNIYRKTSSISRTQSQNLNVSCILLQLSSLNPLKPVVKLRMKM